MSVVKAETGSGFVEERSDADLIESCLNSDQAAWEALIRRYQNLIYSVPIRYHFSASDAADVFQHVCVTMLEKLKTLRNTQTLSSWLYVTTKRHCWKIAKKQKMEVELEDEDNLADEPQGENLIFQHQVKSSVDQLSEKCRDLLRALYYADPPLSYDEVTTKFGIPSGSIGPTRARCLEKLKKILTAKE